MQLNKHFAISLFAVLSLFATSYVNASNYNFPKIYHFNDKIWKLDFQEASNHSILAEYVADGETAQYWTQLFTYQQLKKRLPTNVTPRDFADHVDAGLKGKGLKYTFQVLSSSPSEAILEFRIKSPKTAQQDELQRVIKMKGGVYVILHYVIKKQDMGNKERGQWINNLKTVPIVLL